MEAKPGIEILLLGDSDTDAICFHEALATCKCAFSLVHLKTPVQVMQYLRGEHPLTKTRITNPGLVIVDLDLPAADPFEFLSTLKSTPGLRLIPVIVLSTCADEAALDRAYRLGANAFLKRPASDPERRELLRAICGAWSLSTLPQWH